MNFVGKIFNNYSIRPSWIWSDKITSERVARFGYNHFISKKGEWNDCFSKFSNRVLPPILKILKIFKVPLWSNFYLLIFLGVSQRILRKNENAVYRLQISALVPEIFKFEKCLKYATKYSTHFYIMYINRATLANLQRRALKLGRLIVLQKTHLWL